MKNSRSLLIVFFLGFYIQCPAQMFEFSPRDAAKLPNRKLIVVLQEESPELLKRIKKDLAKTERYKALIKYTNSITKKAALEFWKAGQEVEFKTTRECAVLSDSSNSYFTLEFASLRVNENTQLYQLKPDTLNPYKIRDELMRRKEVGYFELKLIEKFRATAFYTFYTPSSIPNEYDFITAIQFMSALVKEKLMDPKFSTRNYEDKIQQNNKKLFDRNLVVDSSIVNKQSKGYAYIRSEYDSSSLYTLSDPKGIVEKAYSKDSTYAYLSIVPYIDPIARGQSYLGTSGGNINDYEKTIYYMQLIFDLKTGELIYYDKSEERVVLVKDWKRFLRYSRENPFFLPSLPKSNAPKTIPNNQQQKYYQNQY